MAKRRAGIRLAGVLLALATGVAVAAYPPAGGTGHASAASIDRDFQPVVLTGSSLPGLQGLSTSSIVVYAYDSGISNWAAIPSQVDERADVTLQGQCVHTALMFAEEDGLLDADDELAFMASDLGDLAPDNIRPPADSRAVYRVEVTDPRPGGGQGWAYVAASASPPPPPADYVSYTTTRSLPDEQSIVSEDTLVETAGYQAHFSGRWTMDGLTVKPGPDVLDKLRGTVYGSPDSPGETEFLWDGTSQTLYFKGGPVQALRVIRGAASGPAVTYTVEFYASYIRWLIHLRVHGVTDIYRFFDYNANAKGMTYYRSTTPTGFTIDGIADFPGSDVGPWEEVTGAAGTLVHYLSLDTNAAYPTPYYRDATGITEPSGGDGNAYGNHGVHLPDVADTDCGGPGNYLVGDTSIYVLPPDQGRVGDQYAELEENPMQVTVQALPTAPVGGIAELPDVAATAPEAERSASPSVALVAAVATALAAGAIALGGAAWYVRGR